MTFKNIYIHVPFCSKKCDYCNFYSIPEPTEYQLNAFLNHLELELSEAALTEPVTTLFFGGGTPSMLKEHDLLRLIAMTKRYVPLAEDAEITMECNPETLNNDNLDVFCEFINRFSIGVQSFSRKMSNQLGRRSHCDNISSILTKIRKHGINNINIDLIYGIPGQSGKDWMDELKAAMANNVKHLSCYALTLEEGTKLADNLNNSCPADDDESAAMWAAGGKFLKSNGLPRYEVSNHAAPGAECRHNMNVWYGQPYLGLGPAAASFDGRIRWSLPESLEEWIRGAPPERDIIEPEYRMVEIFIIGLRTVRGWQKKFWMDVPLQEFFPVEWEKLLERAAKVKNKFPELIAVEPDSIRLTEKGLLFWNTIAEAWLE